MYNVHVAAGDISCEYIHNVQCHVIQDEMAGLLNTQEELKKGNQKINKMTEDMEKKKVVPVYV